MSKYEPCEMDAIFEHVKAAIQNIQAGEPDKALHLLQMIYPDLAYYTLKVTTADPGTPHWEQLVEAIRKAWPPEENWKDYVS